MRFYLEDLVVIKKFCLIAEPAGDHKKLPSEPVHIFRTILNPIVGTIL
jgi:hypothetical protein